MLMHEGPRAPPRAPCCSSTRDKPTGFTIFAMEILYGTQNNNKNKRDSFWPSRSTENIQIIAKKSGNNAIFVVYGNRMVFVRDVYAVCMHVHVHRVGMTAVGIFFV